MQIVLMLLTLQFIAVCGFAQELETVSINGADHYVYPVEVPVDPTTDFLRVFGMTEEEFSLYRTWIKNNDPSLQTSAKSLIDTLDATLIRDRLVSTEDLKNSRKELIEPQHHVHKLLIPLRSYRGIRARLFKKMAGPEKKSYGIKKRLNKKKLANTLIAHPNCQTEKRLLEDAVPPPIVQDLPDGKYILYYDHFFTPEPWTKASFLDKRPAMYFNLKSNLLDGPALFFTYSGDTLYSGSYNMGLLTGEWQLKAQMDKIFYRENWLSIRQYVGVVVNVSNLRLSFTDGFPDGNFQRLIDYQQWEDETFGHFTHGVPDSIWTNSNNGSIITYDFPQITEPKLEDYFSDWVDQAVPETDVNFTFGELTRDERAGNIFKRDHLRLLDSPGLKLLKNLSYPKGINYGVVNSTTPENIFFTDPFGRYTEKKSMDDGRLIYRFLADHDHKIIVGSRYFEEGALFDTCGIDETGHLIHRIYDVNGKLYLETEYNSKNGDVLSRKFTVAPNVLILDRLSGVELLDSKKYAWWGDTIIDQKRYFKKIWSDKKIPSEETYYDLEKECFIERDFLPNGKPLNESCTSIPLAVVDSLSTVPYGSSFLYELNRKANRYPVVSRFFLDAVTFEIQSRPIYDQYMDTTGSRNNRGRVLYHGIPFNGELVLHETKRSHKPKLRGNRLVVPVYHLSQGYDASSDYSYKRESESDRDPILELRSVLDLFFELGISSRKILFFEDGYELQCEKASGLVKNGYLSGDWKFTAKGFTVADMHYTDSASLGIQSYLSTVYPTPDYYKERYEKDPNFALYNPVVEKEKDYIAVIRHFYNGELNGPGYDFNGKGDTISRYYFKNSRLDGYYSRQQDGKRTSGMYHADEPQGTMIFALGYYEYKNGGGKWRGDTLILASYQKGIKQGKGFNKANQQDIYTQFKDDYPVGETRVIDNKIPVKTIFTKEQGIIERFDHYKEGVLSYTQLPLSEDTFQLDVENDFNVFLRGEAIFDFEDGHFQHFRINSNGELPNAYFKKYYPDGSIAREGVLKNIHKTGIWNYHSLDGTRSYSIRYLDSVFYTGSDSLIIKGIELLSSSNGNQQRYLLEENDFYRCTSDEYFAVRQYIDPGVNGTVYYTYDDGIIMSNGSMKKGLPDGIWRFYDRTGGLMRIGAYQNGKRIGRWLEGDLNDKANLDNICLDEDNPELDILVKQLEKDKKINVKIYVNGQERSNQEYRSEN